MTHFAVDPTRTALLIIDMQNVFVADSPIAAPLGREVAERLNRLAAAGRQSGVTVIWTRHVVRPDGSNVGLLGQTIPPVADGIINSGAPTAALHPLMDLRAGDIVLDKPRFGSFYGTDLERDFRVLFLSDGTANFDLPDGGLGAASAEELQRAACAIMAFGFAEVLTVDEVLSRIPIEATA